METKKLHLSKEHRAIAGVCGGLAEYFETDPMLVRLIFLFFALIGGGGVFLYLVLWLFLSDNKELHHLEHEIKSNAMHHHNDSVGVIGFFLILIGVLLLFDNLFPGFGLKTFWPLLLIFFGLAIMLRKHRDHHE